MKINELIIGLEFFETRDGLIIILSSLALSCSGPLYPNPIIYKLN